MKTRLLHAIAACVLLAAPAMSQQQLAGFVRNPSFDTEPPQLPADMKPGGVLIFSKTSGYRDEPAMQASDAALAAICAGARLALLRDARTAR